MRLLLKQLLAPFLYRRPVPELSTDRLHLYFEALSRTRSLPGAVVEVGCFQGATAALAWRRLQELNIDRRYVCVDTFGGFVASQFDRDAALGTAAKHRDGFRINSRALVRRLLDRWGCEGVALVEGDVASLPDEQLPPQIVVALIDVDLEAPTYAALVKIHQRLVAGGIVLIDDCSDEGNTFRGARVAYRRFTAEHNLPEQYAFGMGWIGPEEFQGASGN